MARPHAADNTNPPALVIDHKRRIAMSRKFVALLGSVLFGVFAPGVVAQTLNNAFKEKGETKGAATPILWREPADIASRNLLEGPGGKEHEPHPPFTFEKEDMEGSNPKFDVRDQDGVKWKVKLGAEAKPETVATRLVWAIGYFANEDYFLPDFRANGMPAHLQRGNSFVEADGSMKNVRLKRYVEGEKKIGSWEWRKNPFTDTRELNGLRVMMAVINNWDLKDDNNAIYREKHSDGGVGAELVYMVSDLGSSFGTTNFVPSHEKAKGNLDSYVHSKFIQKGEETAGDFVDFQDPHRPALLVAFNAPEFVSRLNLEWIGRHIPKADAKWTGQLLARLSREQIRGALRAAQYSPDEVEAFASALELRIAELNQLYVGSAAN
jgi:hypothetical protein